MALMLPVSVNSKETQGGDENSEAATEPFCSQGAQTLTEVLSAKVPITLCPLICFCFRKKARGRHSRWEAGESGATHMWPERSSSGVGFGKKGTEKDG